MPARAATAHARDAGVVSAGRCFRPVRFRTPPRSKSDLLPGPRQSATRLGYRRNVSLDPRVDIGHVHLKVADIDRSLAFYRDILGFDVMQRMGDQAAFISAGGYHHHLGLNTGQSRNAPQAPANSVGLGDYTIFVPGAEALDPIAARLDAASIKYERSADTLSVDDPWGNHVRIVAEK